MKVISSQRYIDNSVVTEKMEELQGATSVELVVWTVGIDDMVILCDGHHTLAAARELGLNVSFVETMHPEGLTGEDLLEQAWMDSDWYEIETGSIVF